VTLVVAALLLAGCADSVPRHTDRAASPPVPCLSQADDGLFATCLRTELDDVWGREFHTTGRNYASPQLTVGEDTGSGTGRVQELTRDRAYYSPRTGIHVPTRYLDDVRAAHGSRAHIVLSFTLSHETGHQVQHLLHPRIDAPGVDVETQADCYAGVWARQEANARELDAGQFRTGAEAELRRLSADPEEVRSHGGVDQRIAALDKGLRTGDPAACDVGGLSWR
jgi:hypothetical protein